MAHSYTRNDLKDIFFSALEMFNDYLDSDINKDNIRIDFFVPENGIKVYEHFCSRYFPKYLDEPYKSNGYFDEIAAQAFVSESCYGVLIREDIDFKQDFIVAKLLDRSINVKGNCKVHRAVYDRLTEVLEELRRIEAGASLNDELLANINLILSLVDNLYIKTNI